MLLEWVSPEARDNIASWSGVRTSCVGEFVQFPAISGLKMLLFFVQLPAISGFDPKTGSCQGLSVRMEGAIRHEWQPPDPDLDDSWHLGRLELDCEVDEGNKQQLSGQVREVSAREVMCVSIEPPSGLRTAALGHLRLHLSRLYRDALPPLVTPSRWAKDAGKPALPFHPALPALFAVSTPSPEGAFSNTSGCNGNSDPLIM